MPIYPITCASCGISAEILVKNTDAPLQCPECGSLNTTKEIASPSALNGRNRHRMPGKNDTGCCGTTVGEAACAGPGSCCGRSGS